MPQAACHGVHRCLCRLIPCRMHWSYKTLSQSLARGGAGGTPVPPTVPPQLLALGAVLCCSLASSPVVASPLWQPSLLLFGANSQKPCASGGLLPSAMAAQTWNWSACSSAPKPLPLAGSKLLLQRCLCPHRPARAPAHRQRARSTAPFTASSTPPKLQERCAKAALVGLACFGSSWKPQSLW